MSSGKKHVLTLTLAPYRGAQKKRKQRRSTPSAQEYAAGALEASYRKERERESQGERARERERQRQRIYVSHVLFSTINNDKER
jgi:hypothetical protein